MSDRPWTSDANPATIEDEVQEHRHVIARNFRALGRISMVQALLLLWNSLLTIGLLWLIFT